MRGSPSEPNPSGHPGVAQVISTPASTSDMSPPLRHAVHRAFGQRYTVRPPEELEMLGTDHSSDRIVTIWVAASGAQYHEAAALLRSRGQVNELIVAEEQVPVCAADTDIIIGPGFPATDLRSIAELAAKFLFPLLLDHREELLLLHCSASFIQAAPDGAPAAGLLFIGDSGAGKSTSAALLLDQGHAVLTDDLLPLGLHPGEESFAIAGDSAVRLHETAPGLVQYPSMFDGKLVAFRAECPPIAEMVPLLGVALKRGARAGVIRALPPVERLPLLHGQLFHYVPPSGERRRRSFRSCATLAQQMPVVELGTGASVADLRTALADLLAQRSGWLTGSLRVRIRV